MAYYIAPYQQRVFNKGVNATAVTVTGMDTYRKGESEYAADMANMETPGYMHQFLTFVTDGYYGSSVKGVRLNGFNEELRGPMEMTNRPLDISVDGKGFLIVDHSGSSTGDILHGMKTTGRFQIDALGYVHDEAGNHLLGVPANPDGTTTPFSLLEHLERVQLPLTPTETIATQNIKFKGVLPAKIGDPGVVKSNAVDIFDSLGVVHQLNFEWQNVGPRLWNFSVTDSKNTPLVQGEKSKDDWSKGIAVGFGPDGKYAGVIAPDSSDYSKYTDYQTAVGTLKGGKEAVAFLQEYIAQHPTDDATAIKGALTTFIGTLSGDSETGAKAVDTAIKALTGTPDGPKILSVSETTVGTQQTEVDTALTALESCFNPTSVPPNVYAKSWLNEAGGEVGSLPSDLRLDLSGFIITGDSFDVQTPIQDGAASSHLKNIRIDPNGILSFEFDDQESRAAWLLPLINFYNNNGMEQGDKNVLRPQPQCGEYILSRPGDGPLGRVLEKMVTKSNVDPQETLMKAHRMAYASDNNATLYKMVIQTDKFLLQIFSQL